MNLNPVMVYLIGDQFTAEPVALYHRGFRGQDDAGRDGRVRDHAVVWLILLFLFIPFDKVVNDMIGKLRKSFLRIRFIAVNQEFTKIIMVKRTAVDIDQQVLIIFF